MVFVDKTLDQLLREIDYGTPIKIGRGAVEIDPTKSYHQVREFSIQDTGDIFHTINGQICELYRFSVPDYWAAWVNRKTALSELISNALEWGEGIKEADYYFAQKGLIVELVQNKKWNYDKILKKISKGLYPSSRKKDDTTMHGGGCGLHSAKLAECEISYQNTSTFILITQEIIKDIKRLKTKDYNENLRNR